MKKIVTNYKKKKKNTTSGCPEEKIQSKSQFHTKREKKKKNGKRTEEERMDQVAADDALTKRLDENPREKRGRRTWPSRRKTVFVLRKLRPIFRPVPNLPLLCQSSFSFLFRTSPLGVLLFLAETFHVQLVSRERRDPS